MTNIQFDILPQRSALLTGHATEIHALLRAQAPAWPARQESERSPLNLSLVLDRYGSMAGPPLEEAKRCAAYIIDQLDERDRLAVVTHV